MDIEFKMCFFISLISQHEDIPILCMIIAEVSNPLPQTYHGDTMMWPVSNSILL